ncbi:MAG: DUF4347 domain-containing protein, partial [Pseudomonadota bacterium]
SNPAEPHSPDHSALPAATASNPDVAATSADGTLHSLPRDDVLADGLADTLSSFSAPDADQRQLVFIDTRTPDYESMLVDLTSVLSDIDFEVVFIEPHVDGLQVVTSVLEQQPGVTAVHIISHGSDGSIALGDVTLDNTVLQARATEISRWSAQLSTQADILIYGCNLAATAQGQALVDGIAELSRRDVAASTDFTGHHVLSGDWELEYQTGAIEAGVPFSASFQQSWQSSLDITSNLVAHYEFEEGSGTTSADSSVNNNAGTLSNTAIWTTDAAVGNYALDFSADSGANYRFSVPDNAALDFGGSDFTVSFWMKASVVPAGTINVVGQDASGPGGYHFTTDHFADVNFDVRNGFVYVEDVHDNNWQLITGTRAAGVLSIYQDGVLIDSDPVSGGTVNGTFDFMVGATSATTDDYEGLIDDIRIYNRALSVADINELLSPPNSAPVISALDATPVYTEGGTAVLIDTDVQVADTELDALNGAAGNYSGASFTLARHAGVNTEDTFSFVDGNGLSKVGSSLYFNAQMVATVDQSAGHISATFTDANGEVPTTAVVSAFMQQITYANSSDSPPASVDLQWVVNDGNAGAQGYGGEQIGTATVSVFINAQNDAPVLDNSGVATLTGVLQNSADNGGTTVAQMVASAGADIITDADAGALEGIALLTADSINGTWQFSTDNGVSWTTTNPSAGSAVLLAPTSLLRFEPVNGFTGTADITFRAWDKSSGAIGTQTDASAGGGLSAFSTAVENATIQVHSLPDYSITAPASANVAEDTNHIFSGTNALTVSDNTLSDTMMRVSVEVTSGQLTLNSLTGISFIEGNQGNARLVIEGLESDINTALDGLKYLPAANFSGADSLKISAQIASVSAFYPFDTDAGDYSDGTGYHGTLQGITSIVSDPDRGNVLLLSGLHGSDVRIPGNFSGSTSLTASAWVNASSGYSEVISIGGGSFTIRVDDPNRAGNVTAFYHNGSQYFFAIADQTIAGTGWRHLAASLDDTSDELTLYIDGVVAARTTGSGSVQLPGDSYIGSNNGGSLFLNGRIDQVYVFDRALSAESIALLATDGSVVKDTIAINVLPINDVPVVANIEPVALQYTEDDGPVAMTASMSVADPDDTMINSA